MEQTSSEFKARPFNRRIFETACKLPLVDKRNTTGFDEFHLSKSNAKLAKKTFIEYITNKENACSNQLFRARSFDRKKLEEMVLPKTEMKRQLT